MDTTGADQVQDERKELRSDARSDDLQVAREGTGVTRRLENALMRRCSEGPAPIMGREVPLPITSEVASPE